MNYVIACLLGYAFGCIQAAYLIGKVILKKDIRKFGSGNAGASNATMTFGKKFGVIVGLIDIAKAIVSFFILRLIIGDSVSENEWVILMYLNGLFVIIGHNFPFYMKFKGGKGTAALVGLLLAINPVLGVTGGLTLIFLALITDYIAVGTLGLLVVFMIHTLIYRSQAIVIITTIMIIAMSIYKHYPNFIKIMNKTETKVRSTIKK